MKVNYFAYYLTKDGHKDAIEFDIRPLIAQYCKLNNPVFKGQFFYGEENLYLLPHLQDTFFFLITKNSEDIRKIDTQSMSLDQIDSLLNANEHIGISSYALIKEDFIGFCTTISAPKAAHFASYINELLIRIGLGKYQFHMYPLSIKATKADVLNMAHIGRTNIEFTQENSALEMVCEVLGMDKTKISGLQGLEIIMKPIAGENIKEPVADMINHVSDTGITKMVSKAKGKDLPQLVDMYVVGKEGVIQDTVTKVQEKSIAITLNDKVKANKRLGIRLKEFKNERKIKQGDCGDLDNFANASAWASVLPIVPTNN